jgi:hypothetical protein
VATGAILVEPWRERRLSLAAHLENPVSRQRLRLIRSKQDGTPGRSPTLPIMSRPRAGGDATAGGVTFQARVAAFFAVRVLAEQHAASLPGFSGDVVPTGVWCETTEALDDIEVRSSAGARLLVQVKRTLVLGASPMSELAKVCDQLVRAGAPPDARPDGADDRLLLAVGPGTGAPVARDLRELLDALRPQPATAGFRRAHLSEQRARVQDVLLAHLRRSWRAVHGREATTPKLRELLRRTYVVILDVEDGGRDAAASEELLRQTVLGRPDTARAAWTFLMGFCADLARLRTGADRGALQTALVAHGIGLQAPPSVRPDITELRQLTKSTVRLLEEFARIDVHSGSVSIERDVPDVLEAAAASGSFVVVGEPGIGKSGALHQLVRRAQNGGTDVVALTVEPLEAGSQTALTQELGLSRTFADVLAAWPGERGLLIVDGLDAARSDHVRRTITETIRRVLDVAPRWRVVASIRTFDLRYDPTLPRLFPALPNSPIGQAWMEPEFVGIEHVRVAPLTDSEIEQLAIVGPQLHGFITTAPPAMRTLARVPFNLRLLAELLAVRGMPGSALREIDTQVGLLDAYWRERVLWPVGEADQRERLLHVVCQNMIDGRRLTISRGALRTSGIDLGPLTALLHDHVLMERPLPPGRPDRERLAFAHNVLFDYAVARLLLRAEGALAALLAENPSLLLRIRPSIDLHMRELWSEDAQRAAFWQKALDLAAEPGLRELARTVAPAVAAELARTSADLADLVAALGERAEAADAVARHVIGALMAFSDANALVGPASPWPGFAVALSQSLTAGRARILQALVATLLDHRLVASPAALAHIGAAARALLHFAWHIEPVDERLAEFSIGAVRQTFATDPAPSEALLRRVLQPAELETRGYRQLPRLADDIQDILPLAPVFVADIYRAAFTHVEPSEEPTALIDSELVGMRSTRRQDWGMAHYALQQAFPAFLERAPPQAIDALDVVVDAHVARRRDADRQRILRLRLAQRSCGIRADGSHIWNAGFAHGDEERLLRQLEQRIGSLARDADAGDPAAGPALDALVDELVTGTRNAALWRPLLTAASQHPERFVDRLGEVLAKPALYLQVEVQHPMALALAAMHSLLDTKRRQAAERAILRVPALLAEDLRDLGEQRRDELLASLDSTAILTSAARKRRAELDALDEPVSAPRPPYSFSTSARRGITEDDLLREQGADPTKPVNAELLRRGAPLRAFIEQHPNKLPTDADRKAILPPLKRLWAAVTSDTSDADEPALQRTWGTLAEVAEILARAPGRLTPAAGRVVTDILLSAAHHPVPGGVAGGLQQFDRQPSWGGGSPRIEAAEGLTALCQERKWANPDVLGEVLHLSRDPVASVRFAVARRVNALAATAPDLAWQIVGERVAKDRSAAVLQALLQPLVRLVNVDQQRALDALRHIVRRERRRREPRQELLTKVYRVLAALAVWREAPAASRALAPLLTDAAAHSELVVALLDELRAAVIHGAAGDDQPDARAVRGRGLDIFRRALGASLRELAEIERRHGVSTASWPPEAVARWRAAAQVADAVADQLFFASGVFQEAQQEGDDPGVDAAQRARLYHEAHDLLERLAHLGHRRVVHHLLELLEGCIDEDPRGVFRLVAAAVAAGEPHGYQYESLALRAVVRIVGRYLGQHREVFEDEELATALMDVLDVFVAVGWPDARRLVYSLDELYR